MVSQELLSKNAVVVEHVDFSYENKQVFENLSVCFAAGQTTLIAGEKGSGKTTLLKLIAGLLSPSAGEIFICGNRIIDSDAGELEGYVSFLPFVTDYKVDSCVRDFLLSQRKAVRSDYEFSVEDYRKIEEYSVKTGVANLLLKDFNDLSTGEKQLVRITGAFVRETSVVLLDEPLTSIDFAHREKLLNTFQHLNETLGVTVILSVRNSDKAFCERYRVCRL